jgi:hypothetical protein
MLSTPYIDPELKFDEQARKHCFNNRIWGTKTKPILPCFNKMPPLLTSPVDDYFQRVPKQVEGD